MSLFPFAFMTASGRSQSLNAERLINLYAEQSMPGSVSELILRSIPGNDQWAIVGVGPIRGWHTMNMSNVPTVFAVSGNDLYEVHEDGTSTLRGAAGTILGSGDVSMSSNANNEIVIGNSDGAAWVWDNALLQSLSTLDPDFGDDATNFTFLDQYTIYARKGTGQVFASDLNNMKSWNALSFATAESAPDNVVEVLGHNGQLWIFGEKTTEIFYNAATSPFAFARIGGAVMQDIGAIAGTISSVDQSAIWLAQNGTIYKASGIQPQRISTHAIEYRLKGRTGFRAWTYVAEGHAFYVLGSDQGAEVYDITTGFWHERTGYNVGRYRPNNHAKVYGKHLVGDYHLGIIYNMSLDNYADGSSPLQRVVISAPIYDNGKMVPLSSLEVMFENGVGLGQASYELGFTLETMLDEDGLVLLDEDGEALTADTITTAPTPENDPAVVMSISTDGGKTFGLQKWGRLGKAGENRKRAIWNRLGSKRKRNLKLVYTAATPYTIYGGTLK